MFKIWCSILFIQSLFINQNFAHIPISKDDEIREGLNWVWSQIHENANLKSVLDVHRVLDIVKDVLTNNLNLTAVNNTQDVQIWLQKHSEEVAKQLRELKWPEDKIRDATDWKLEDGGIDSLIDKVQAVGRTLNFDNIPGFFTKMFEKKLAFLKRIFAFKGKGIMWIIRWINKIFGTSYNTNLDVPPNIDETVIEVGKYINNIIIKDNNYFLSDDKTSWYKASAKCADLGMNLVSIFSGDENMDLHQVIRTHPSLVGQFTQDFWIGGIYTDMRAVKTYSDYSKEDDVDFDYTWYPSRKVFGYTQWDDYHPLNESKPCVKFTFRLTGSVWRSEDCYELLRYVCQKIEIDLPQGYKQKENPFKIFA